ncbi:uncharacterized protein LOC131970328 isoform X2 [Centropristis striata]|uniref:uncharacterized protein LOC131970328 isoform X2 n=1 Tax=Centropristis striata TaxID=184440 RepID=UPI0027DFE099|nr:uncharacterized protein LOC131970328 isoform X2 [Centropristis striata]
MKRAKYHIMSETVDVNTEPLKWPIAADGHIPNSVIYDNWVRMGKFLTMDRCDDIFYNLHLVDEGTTNQEDVSRRVFCSTQDEEEDDVKRRKKEKENEKNVRKITIEVKERMADKKEKEEDKSDRIVVLKQPHDIQTKTTLKTFDVGQMNMEPQMQETGSTYNLRKTVNFLPPFCQESGPKQLREQMEDERREDVKLQEAFKPPLKYRTVPYEDRRSSIIQKKKWPEHPVKSPVIPKQGYCHREPRVTSCRRPTEPKNLTPDSPKAPPPTPEDLKPQQDLGPLKCSPIRDRKFLPSSTKYNNIRDQERKVLTLYKRLKCAQTVLPINDQRGYTLLPEWRKTLYNLIALQGFRSPRAARLAASEYPVKSSNATRPKAAIPSLQPGQAAAHQRVVHKIQMKDTLDPASSPFHPLIPMASQQSFCTLNPCGKTQYGRLQFYWTRGHDELALYHLNCST